MPRSVLALTLALAVALGCGGSNSTDPGGTDGTGTGGNNGGSNNSTTCTMTLTGAQTDSLTCSRVSAVRTDNDDKTGFGFNAADGMDTVAVSIGFSGPPTTTRYDNSTGADAVLLINDATTFWILNSPVDPWSLTISSVKETSSGAGLTGYEVHGTLTATLPVANGTGTGPVTLNATF